jgi:CRISPR-associated endonuclease Cas1
VRRYSRVERTLRRIVITSDRGYISLDAYRWCSDLGVTVVQLDRTGRMVFGTRISHNDARMIRAQALTGDGGPYYATGLAIVKNLLAVKLSGQASIAADVLGNASVAALIREHADRVDACSSINDARGWEAAAASAYWDAWSGMVLPLRPSDLPKVPAHWTAFDGRTSNATPERNRNATNPVNAVLNYAYRLAEIECTMAIQAVGLDSSLGYLHLDEPGRDSLSMDVIEVVRPAVERFVLDLFQCCGRTSVTRERLDARWFHELPNGQCRLVAPLTHMVAEAMPMWARVVAPHVDQIARMVAAVGKGDVKPATRLTGTVMAAERKRGREPRPPRVAGIVTVDRILPDHVWSQVSALLPPKPAQRTRGGRWADDRAVMAGIVCVELLGSSWARIPATLGTNRWTCKARLDLLNMMGVWDSIRSAIVASGHVESLTV